MKQWILSLEKVLIKSAVTTISVRMGERIIVSYSDKRAKKDTYNRDCGILPD